MDSSSSSSSSTWSSHCILNASTPAKEHTDFKDIRQQQQQQHKKQVRKPQHQGRSSVYPCWKKNISWSYYYYYYYYYHYYYWTLIAIIVLIMTSSSHRIMSFPLGMSYSNKKNMGRLSKNSAGYAFTTTSSSRIIRRNHGNSRVFLLPRLSSHPKKKYNYYCNIQTNNNHMRNSNNKNHNNNNNMKNKDEIDFETLNVTFEFGSFDKQGQWMTMDHGGRDYHLPSSSSTTTTTTTNSIFDQNDNEARIPVVFSPLAPSPVELSLIRDRMVYIKRDDLLRLRKSNVSGNKARKMLALNELPMEEFPDAIVSYGGPQSNAMVALAAIVNARNVELMGCDDDAKEQKGGGEDGDDDDDDEIQNNEYWLQDDFKLDNDIEEDDDDDDDDHVRNGKVSGKELKGNHVKLQSLFSTLAHKKRFVYYTKKLPRYLRNQPNGNLLRALSLGMELVELSNDEYKRMFGGENGGSVLAPEGMEPPVPYKSLWVPQGAACALAIPGAKLMAEEIVGFWSVRGNGMPLTVVLPGGTCASAMLLSREINKMLKEREESSKDGNGNGGGDDDDNDDGNDGDDHSNQLDIVVSVIPCIGDEAYAERQMKALDLTTGGNGKDDIPLIFKPWKNAFPRFGEPCPHVLKTFMDMKNNHGIFLDLLYGAAAWNTLLPYLTSQRDSPIKGRQVMYVHSGGLEGVSSQLTRYRHKGLIDSSHLQS